MEKLTPTKFSATKTISGNKDGRDYSFQSAGFQTREYGERWFNIAFKGTCPLKEGITTELEIKERPYKAKDGTDKIAYDAKLPGKESIDTERILNALRILNDKLDQILAK